MYDFSKKILKDEEILYTSRPIPGKGGMSSQNILVLIVITLVFLAVAITLLTQQQLLPFLIVLFFVILMAYGLMRETILKKGRIIDEHYCITSQRILKYEEEPEKIYCGYLSNFNSISIRNEKENYGDVYFSINLTVDQKNTTEKEQIKEVVSTMEKISDENMPEIAFESIENPREVARIALEARRKIVGESITTVLETPDTSQIV